MNILTEYVVPSGVILTFAATLISIYYTRKNSKSTKYIDTITSERIKWIEKIRLEVADLNSCFLTIIKNKGFIIQITEKNKKSESLFAEMNTLHQTRELEEEISSFSKTDILRKINTIRLRLNPVDDKEILICLNELAAFILNVNHTNDSVSKIWETNMNMISLTQLMLKQEWEKVKREAKS